MANANYDSILTTTLESRGKKIADNVSNNNAAYLKMAQRGNVRPFSGGHKIIEPLSYAENANAGWFSGADVLTTGLTDELTAPEFTIKQLAATVVMTGLDRIKNSGPEAVIDLMEAKIKVAESTIENSLNEGLFADGTGCDGKELTGLGAAVPITVTNTYGNINRNLAANAWWRSRATDSGAAPSSATLLGLFNTEYYALSRGTKHPDLVLCDDVTFGVLEGIVQNLLRFSTSKMAEMGFTSIMYKGADVVLSTGIGDAGTDVTAFFLNTEYLHLRPHKDTNMVVMNPEGTMPYNQNVISKTLLWAGNLTCSGSKFQSRLTLNA